MAAKRKLLLLLAGMGAAALALVALVTALIPEQEEKTILFLSLDSLTGITLEWPEETVVLVQDEEGTWIDREDPAYPIRQAIVENMVTTAGEIQAQRQLDSAEDTGLEDPALTVTLEKGEETLTFSLGDCNTLTGDYYAEREGQVYTLAPEVYTAFAYTKAELYAPQAPMELEENLASLEITWEDRKLALTYDSEAEAWSLAGEETALEDQTEVDSLISQLGYTQTSMTITDLEEVARLHTGQPAITVTALGSQAAYFELDEPDEEGRVWLWDSATGYLHQVSWSSVQLWLETMADILGTGE